MIVSPRGMLSVILKQSETGRLRCQSVPERGDSHSATDKGWYCASLQQSYYASFSPVLFLQQDVVLGTFFSSSISSNLVRMRLRNGS
jgi:hypothetical protein